MNNARMWLVVNPTVGIPVFLGAVAVGSFSVHVSVLTNTTWVSDFLAGRELGSSDKSASIADEETTHAVRFDEIDAGVKKARIVLPDGRTATVVIDENQPVRTASAQSD